MKSGIERDVNGEFPEPYELETAQSGFFTHVIYAKDGAVYSILHPSIIDAGRECEYINTRSINSPDTPVTFAPVAVLPRDPSDDVIERMAHSLYEFGLDQWKDATELDREFYVDMAREAYKAMLDDTATLSKTETVAPPASGGAPVGEDATARGGPT